MAGIMADAIIEAFCDGCKPFRCSFHETFVEDCEEGVSNHELQLSALNLEDIPKIVLQLKLVTCLTLNYNKLTELPDDLSSLQNLRILHISGNQLLNLPDCIGEILQLQEIHMDENLLNSLPDSFCNLKNLQRLHMVGNYVEVLPENFGLLQSLKELTADENQLRMLPVTFGNLSSLQILELGDNKLMLLPVTFCQLSQLQVLNLSNNKLANLPYSFGDLPSLKRLDISSNLLNELPTKLASAPNLEKLYAENNVIHTLPEWIGEMESIVELSFRNNKITGSPLSELFPHTSGSTLRYCDLAGNSITSLPNNFEKLVNLEHLDLGSPIDELERRNFQNGNWLRELPSPFGLLTKLTKLIANENQLTHLPDDFGGLVSLEFVDLGQNLLHEVPESFCDLRSLKVCLISKNHLELLPANFGNLSNLEEFRADNNLLSELPESFSKLTNLKVLDLFNNELTAIPEALDKLTKLTRFDIDRNNVHISVQDIPHFVKKVSYPERDPALKDNWRGRGRQDEPNTIKVFSKETGADGPQSSEWNNSALKNALSKSMSLWRSHDGPSERQVFDRPQPQSMLDYSVYCSDDDGEDVVKDDDADVQDDIRSEKTKDSSPQSQSSQVNHTVTSDFKEYGEENWDEEIEASDPYECNSEPVFRHPEKGKRGVSPVRFYFIPSMEHVPLIPDQYFPDIPVDGQFDDADDDDSDTVDVM